jgi:hypothetical protein
MKQLAFVSLFVFSACLAITLPAAATPHAQHSRVQGDTASAEFFSYDASGCISTDVFVFVSESREHNQPGAPTDGGQVFADISRYDECHGFAPVEFLFGDAPLAPEDFQTSGNAQSATFHKTLVMSSFLTGNSTPVTFDITWNGDGAPTTSHTHQVYSSPGLRFSASLHGTSRPATATGSISDGTTQFAPVPSLSASLTSTTTGSVTLQ